MMKLSNIYKEVRRTKQLFSNFPRIIIIFFNSNSACDLAKEQKRNFGDDIALQLRTARKKRWNVQEERRICQEIELQTYLNKLINDDMEKRIGNIKLDDTKNEDTISKEVTDVEQECENHMTELNNLFAKIDDRRRVSLTKPKLERKPFNQFELKLFYFFFCTETRRSRLFVRKNQL